MSNPDTRRRITRPNDEQDAQEHRVNERKGTPTKPKEKGRQNIPDKNKEKLKGDVPQNQEGGKRDENTHKDNEQKTRICGQLPSCLSMSILLGLILLVVCIFAIFYLTKVVHTMDANHTMEVANLQNTIVDINKTMTALLTSQGKDIKDLTKKVNDILRKQDLDNMNNKTDKKLATEKKESD